MSPGFAFDKLLTLYLSEGMMVFTALLLIAVIIGFIKFKGRKSLRVGCVIVGIYCILYLGAIFALSFLFSSNHGPAQPTLVSADSVVYAEVREMNKKNARELEAKMVSTVEQMSENPLEATGYELTQFENILDFVANEHDSLKLYQYRYAITVAHPECDGWSGGMYLDSKLRVQDAYRWAGYVAILESRGSVVETLWYDSDYSFDDGSLEIDSSDYDAQLRRWAEKTINETPMGD